MRAATIKRLASDCGFDLVGVTPAVPAPDAELYLEWVAAGMAGRMGYLTDHRARIRTDPRNLLSSAKSIISVAKSYGYSDCTNPFISRYAQGEDYHEVLRRDLTNFTKRTREELGPFDYRICVDTAPLLERSYARLAGLGWIGKNTCLINQEKGSYLYLGEVLTSLELEYDQPAPYRCGTCTRCIDACPTEALEPGGYGTRLDSRRCISYFTIELKGGIPESARQDIGSHVFGCDICQEVCPWNRDVSREQLPAATGLNLQELAMLTREEFRGKFRNTAIWRTKYSGFLRNVAIALGNSGQERFRPALNHLAQSEDAVVSEHARWALARLDPLP